MLEFLFIDLDDTILDFKAQEDAAITKTLRGVGIDPTKEVCDRYSQINKEHWARMEKGEINRDQVLYGRFEVLFAELGVTADAKATAMNYMENLSEGHYFLPGAEDAVKALSKKYRLFIASNGTAKVQNKRLDSSGIRQYFEKIFIGFKELLIQNNLQLTSEYFSSSGADKSKLAKFLVQAAMDIVENPMRYPSAKNN